MENQEQENARMRSEIDDLRGNICKIMDMLQVLTAKIDPPRLMVILEISGASFDPQPSRIVPSTRPPFGFPPNYSPPHEETSDIVQTTQHVVPLPLITEAQPIIHTVAQP